MRFREDILRGVRLFAIVFAAVLVCVAAYRIVRAPSDVQGAALDSTEEAVQPPPEQPASDAAPVSETSSEVHPLVVPEPPPVGGPVARPRVTRLRDPGVPPPPPAAAPVVRARRAPPSGKEFEASSTVTLPAAPVEESPEAQPVPPKQAVGYKSLIEANANRPVEPVAPPVADETTEAPAKGNRFFKAIGKIFRPGGKKESEPSTLQPRQQ